MYYHHPTAIWYYDLYIDTQLYVSNRGKNLIKTFIVGLHLIKTCILSHR